MRIQLGYMDRRTNYKKNERFKIVPIQVKCHFPVFVQYIKHLPK